MIRGVLSIADAEAPSDGNVAAFSAAVGRALWKPITGALLSGFTAGLVAFGAAGGTAGTGLTTDANFSYSAGALTLGNTGASHVIGSTVDSADITTGSLKTLGGLAVTKALNVGTTGTFGNTLRVNRSLSTDVSFASYYTSSNFAFFFAADGTMNWGPSTTAADTFLTRNGVGQLLISASTASSSTTTGALVVTGGVGIGGSIFVGGSTIQAANNSTNATQIIVSNTSTSGKVYAFTSWGSAAGGGSLVGGFSFYDATAGAHRIYVHTSGRVIVNGTTDNGTDNFQVTGAASVTGAYKVSGTQVVASRDTGWTAMTGSPDKATAYATSTVTLAQLAGRVAQMQASLTTHGLFGA